MQLPLRVAISGLVLFLLTAGCAAPAAPATRDQVADGGRPGGAKRIVAAVHNDGTGLFKIGVSLGGEGTDNLFDLLHGGLTIVDGQGIRQPQLAEAVPTLENGLWKLLPDGRMETRWRIKPNAQWQDGAPFTANDLVFTAGLRQDRELPLEPTAAMASIESVVAPDPHTVVVTWSKTYIEADALFSRSPALLPRHVLEGPYAESKATLELHSYWGEAFIGVGPYVIREWVRGSHLTLSANDQYVLGRPTVDEVTVRFITDLNTLMANVLAGEVQLTLGRALSLDQALLLRDQWRDGTVGISFGSWIASYPQFFNPNPQIVADGRFRKALMHATDREEMANSFMRGISAVADGFVSPRRPEGREIEGSIVRYHYDPRRAAQMIEALGYVKGADGVFVGASAERLSLEVRARSTLDIQIKTLFAIADQWKQVGISVEPVVVGDQVEREYRANYPAFEIVRQPNDLDVAALLRYHGNQSPLPENRYVGTNRTRYRNPEYDALLDRFANTIPRPERMQVLGQIVHHMTDQLNIMGMFYDIEPTAFSRKLQNITPGAKELDTTTSWNAHLWDVE